MFTELMGKVKDKVGATAPDLSAMLRAALPADEQLLLRATVVPAASDRSDRTDRAAGHVTGEPGTIARSLPVTGETRVLAVTTRGVSLWDLGAFLEEPAAALEYRLERHHITSVTDSAAHGAVYWRFSFVDSSTFTYRSLTPSADVAAALEMPSS